MMPLCILGYEFLVPCRSKIHTELPQLGHRANEAKMPPLVLFGRTWLVASDDLPMLAAPAGGMIKDTCCTYVLHVMMQYACMSLVIMYGCQFRPKQPTHTNHAH